MAAGCDSADVTFRTQMPAIRAASARTVISAGRRRPQAWQNLAPIMNSVLQSAQASAISEAAAGSVVSTAGSSPAGDRQKSCGAS